jgi:DNA-binding NarL/FixJ family response regulator
LLGALRQVFEGGSYLSRSLAEAFPDIEGAAPAAVSGTGPSASFTPRQREVLELLAQGKVAKEIAASLGISIKTVEFHQTVIMEELGLRTPSELTRYAIAQKG